MAFPSTSASKLLRLLSDGTGLSCSGYGDMTFTEGEYSSSVDKEEMIEISEMVAKNNSNQVYGGEADAALDQEIVTSWGKKILFIFLHSC